MPKLPTKSLPLREVYIGVDPGKNGGIAIFLPGQEPYAVPMPETRQDLWHVFSAFKGCQVFCYIEKVQGYMGPEGEAPGSAMFNFGCNYGLLLMALVAAEIPHEEVPPQQWQKGLHIPPREKKETKTQWKNRLKQKAQGLFPKIKVTLAIADALLIAEYTRRKRQGTL